VCLPHTYHVLRSYQWSVVCMIGCTDQGVSRTPLQPQSMSLESHHGLEWLALCLSTVLTTNCFCNARRRFGWCVICQQSSHLCLVLSCRLYWRPSYPESTEWSKGRHSLTTAGRYCCCRASDGAPGRGCCRGLRPSSAGGPFVTSSAASFRFPAECPHTRLSHGEGCHLFLACCLAVQGACVHCVKVDVAILDLFQHTS